jgi:hypothetical protein
MRDVVRPARLRGASTTMRGPAAMPAPSVLRNGPGRSRFPAPLPAPAQRPCQPIGGMPVAAAEPPPPGPGRRKSPVEAARGTSRPASDRRVVMPAAVVPSWPPIAQVDLRKRSNTSAAASGSKAMLNRPRRDVAVRGDRAAHHHAAADTRRQGRSSFRSSARFVSGPKRHQQQAAGVFVRQAQDAKRRVRARACARRRVADHPEASRGHARSGVARPGCSSGWPPQPHNPSIAPPRLRTASWRWRRCACRPTFPAAMVRPTTHGGDR